MMKLIASALSGAIAVGGAGYTYVSNVKAESETVKQENISLHTKIDNKNRAIDESLKALSDADRALKAARS